MRPCSIPPPLPAIPSGWREPAINRVEEVPASTRCSMADTTYLPSSSPQSATSTVSPGCTFHWAGPSISARRAPEAARLRAAPATTAASPGITSGMAEVRCSCASVGANDFTWLASPAVAPSTSSESVALPSIVRLVLASHPLTVTFFGRLPEARTESR